jgi:hypothetical protein
MTFKQDGSGDGIEVRRSHIYGRGCFALKRFPARKKIASYAGEIIRGRRKIQRRVDSQDAIKVVWVSDDVAIDGAVGGNATAFINHSCDPNAFMRCVSSDKVSIFARRDIKPDEEITIDYRDPDHPRAEDCRCGARNCRSLKA